MIITQDTFKAAFSKLPFAIREYLMGDELTEVVQSIGTNYGLHIDTVGALDREVTNMLLGLENPQQFVGELRSIGISAGSIAPMVQELNQRVFMPLHQKMQEPGADVDPGAEDEAAMLEVAQNIGTLQESPDSRDTGYTAAQPAPAPVLASVPSYTPPAPVSAYQPPVYVPQPVIAPTPAPAVAPAPAVPMPPQNLPTQNPPGVQSTFPRPAAVQSAPSSVPQQGSVPNENRDALHKVMKEYGIDPYREIPE